MKAKGGQKKSILQFPKASTSQEEMKGLEAIKGWATSAQTAFPDFHIVFDEMIVKGDAIVTTWRGTGAHRSFEFGFWRVASNR